MTNSKAILIFTLAAIIGFGAVYVTINSYDNAASKISGNLATDKSADSTPSGASGADDGLAAFVHNPSPKPVKDITFQDDSGNDVSLSSFQGKTILLNFWATWCAPCREEMPSLNNLQKSHGSPGFEVVALSLDRKGVEAAQKFLNENGAQDLKLYIDKTARAGTELGIRGMPTTILIDAAGKEIGRLAGAAEWDSKAAIKLIEAAQSTPPQ